MKMASWQNYFTIVFILHYRKYLSYTDFSYIFMKDFYFKDFFIFSDTIIRTVLLFAEGIFDGESHVV